VNEGALRVRRLTLAGATDSCGLAVGWTVVNLLAVYQHGLSGAGLLNAAMLLGVALSSPAAAWVTRHLHGRHILHVTAVAEAMLRALTIALLVIGVPLLVVAALVLVTNVVAWVGYAGMRAEVARASTGTAAMTRYVAVIIAVEAVGTVIAAALPVTTGGDIPGPWLALVIALYSLSTIPTVFVAQGSSIPLSGTPLVSDLTPQNRRLLGTGTLLMVLCSGPALLFIGLAAELHGQSSVALAALAFAAGSLLAPAAGRAMARTGLPLTTLWLAWGAGMVFGWIAAPWSIGGLCLALLLSGICLTGFEGAMDALLAGSARDGRATASLAHGSAARALGGAAAVKLVPLFSTDAALAEMAAVSSVVCALAAIVVHRVLRDRPVPVAPERAVQASGAARVTTLA
jgi:hypothetical protein